MTFPDTSYFLALLNPDEGRRSLGFEKHPDRPSVRTPKPAGTVYARYLYGSQTVLLPC